MAWRASLHDGWASAWRGELEQPTPLRDLRASAAGDTLRLSLPVAQVRGSVRLARPFRWGVRVTAPIPGDRLPFDVWSDELTERQSLDARLGVLHRP
ncbi:hypothetical protein VSS74_00300 [Conexibacter stalactiti]|uniref:Uncharacterized protein n=1 Tax=Conexibacter stalactiti TaxID=1940611 RepID=A0ABU4HHN7_9ACTN|nr:hypothetical protein [Conexibacter stalactiti]MDW5592755.1 hypothetical protein [Conexibacter stalactiti]MEC5033396.1 hypothetical protein [Conexibacter stalactiti]